jgi:hypothetical protein
MSIPPPIPKTHPNKGSPQNHPRDPLRLYGISRKKREERDVKIQIELETLEKRSEERVRAFLRAQLKVFRDRGSQ